MFVSLALADEDLRSNRDIVKKQWESSNAKKLPRIPKRALKAQYRERDDSTSPLKESGQEGASDTSMLPLLDIPEEVRLGVSQHALSGSHVRSLPGRVWIYSS